MMLMLEKLITFPLTAMTMFGPEFILVFLAIVAVTIAGLRVVVALLDPCHGKRAVPISGNSDVFEIAYLRGRAEALTSFVVFDLIQRGFLEMRKTRDIPPAEIAVAQPATHPSIQDLTGMERAVFDCFSSPRGTSSLLPLSRMLGEYASEYKKHLQGKLLLVSPKYKTLVCFAAWIAVAILFGTIGIHYLAAVLQEQVNMPLHATLIIIALSSIVVIWKISRLGAGCLEEPWQTRLGNRYLDDLQSENSRLRKMGGERQPSELRTAVAIFGVAVLIGTKYELFATNFRSPNTGLSRNGGIGGLAGPDILSDLGGGVGD